MVTPSPPRGPQFAGPSFFVHEVGQKAAGMPSFTICRLSIKCLAASRTCPSGPHIE